MTASLAPRVRGLLALAAGAVVIALVSGRPELAVLAAPLILLVGTGLVVSSAPRLDAEIQLERIRAIEGEALEVAVWIRNDGARTVDIALMLAGGGRPKLDPGNPVMTRLAAAADTTLTFRLSPGRWGVRTFGPVVIRASDPLGVIEWHGQLGHSHVVKVFPREEQLRRLVRPLKTQPFLGAHVARARGEGIEFADVRPFVVGDGVRQINWRVTARRGDVWVTERHPEHASDVVLLIDTFAEARDVQGGTLDAAVRAAASVARTHLARRDRVALVDFGGTLRWLEPAFGTRQLYRIVDALLESDIALSYAWRAVESIPRKILPTGSLVIAISPLLDERSIGLITELRTRGRDLAVVEISPLKHASPGTTAVDIAAYRLWTLQREALRRRLQGLGIAVGVWADDTSLQAGLEEVNAFRRSSTRAMSA